MKYLSARGLGKSYPGAGRIVLDGVDLDLEVGESLALVGRSGSGKSTLGRCLAGLMQVDRGQVEWCAGLHPCSRQFIPQDPVQSMNPAWSAREIFGEPLRIQGGSSDVEIEALIADLMERKNPRTLSGGQAARLALARALQALALVGRPGLLVLDETLSALDAQLQIDVLHTVQRLQRRLEFCLVHITHDWALAEASAGRIAVMHEGRLVEDLEHEAARELQDAVLKSLPC